MWNRRNRILNFTIFHHFKKRSIIECDELYHFKPAHWAYDLHSLWIVLKGKRRQGELHQGFTIKSRLATCEIWLKIVFSDFERLYRKSQRKGCRYWPTSSECFRRLLKSVRINWSTQSDWQRASQRHPADDDWSRFGAPFQLDVGSRGHCRPLFWWVS